MVGRKHPWGAGALAAGALLAVSNVAMAADAAKPVTFSKDVAPILQAKCQSCHEPGSIAPMSLMTFQETRPWARSIKNRVSTRQMPPWHIDKSVGIQKFKNDISLSDEQLATIVNWVDQGAPRDGTTDPLAIAAKKRVVQQWPLGKPDLVLEIPTYTIPASGVVDYQRPIALNPLTEGKWVKASTYVVNHLLEAGGISVGPDGRIKINSDVADADIVRAATEFISAMSKGDAIAVKSLLQHYVVVTAEFRNVLARLGPTPALQRPIYRTADRLSPVSR